jgi:anaphase-promoting complex subunit 4
MDQNAFATLADVILPGPSVLFGSACCPDKDLVALVTRHGSQDKLSLWKIQGSQVWEVDVLGRDGQTHDTVTNLCWSPDGL